VCVDFSIPQTEEIALKICTTAQIPKKISVFTGVPVPIKHVISGVSSISNRFSRECTESPSLKRVYGKTANSGDLNISSLISSMSGM